MQIGGGSSNGHTGIFMENGSGGFMRDLIFNGGGIAFFLGWVVPVDRTLTDTDIL
jgi:hypothetical protein